MRLKKGHFRLVHNTSREIGDGSFHGTVFVCGFVSGPFFCQEDCSLFCEFLTNSCFILRLKILGRNLLRFVQLPVMIYVSLPSLHTKIRTV